jgi:hypothetical protein
MSIATTRTYLTASQSITALVGPQIYPLALPEDAGPPAIVLKIVSLDPENSLTGPTGQDAYTILVENHGTSYAQAQQLAAAVRACLAAQNMVMQAQNEEYDSLVRLYLVSQHWLLWS